jgi:hypothetical protein
MRQGVLLQGLGSQPALRPAVALNSGVRAERAEGEETPRFFPHDDWHSATAEEQDRLLATRATPLPDAVTVLALDPDLRERFWEDVAPLVCLPDQVSAAERQRCLWDFGRRVADALARPGLEAVSLRSCDVQVTPPHHNSTGYDYRNGRHVGLHIDNHDRLPLLHRRGAFQLVCLNLGPVERYLQFVNLAVPDLLAALGCDAAAAEGRYASIRHLVAEFFQAFPDYPVVRVTLPPDHAYVAVTQYVIHDGATNTLGQPDVAFLLGGYFGGARQP